MVGHANDYGAACDLGGIRPRKERRFGFHGQLEMQDAWSEGKFATMKMFAWIALAGVVLACLCFLAVSARAKGASLVAGILLVVPLFVFVALMTIWHWKYRYRGEHPDLRGAILLIETSGWMKMVYWFRHILPDWRGTGGYSSPNQTPIL